MGVGILKRKNSNYKINTSLEFKTNKEEKGHRRFTFGLIFGISVVMLACVCVLLLLREYDFDIDNLIGRTPETTETTETTVAEPVLEGMANFLVACSDDDSAYLHHAAIVNVSLTERKIRIYTLDVSDKVSANGFSGTLSKHLAHGGMVQLKSAAEALTGVEISRYIRATDSSFKGLIKIFGGVPCKVEEKVRYSVDGVGYIIEKGEQTLTPDMSYKYMYYLSQKNENKPELMSSFLADMLCTFLTSENYGKADKIYKSLVNILDTDISAFDFSNNKANLNQFIIETEGTKAELVENTDEFNRQSGENG